MELNEAIISEFLTLYAALADDEQVLIKKIKLFEKKHGIEAIFHLPSPLINDHAESFLCRALNLKKYQVAVYLVEKFYFFQHSNAQERIIDNIQQISNSVQGGIDWLLSTKVTMLYSYVGKEYFHTFLSLMIFKKYDKVIKKIAELGKLQDRNLTLKSEMKDVNVNSHLSILCFAVIKDAVNLVDLILASDAKANFLFKRTHGSLLSYAKSIEMANLIIETAKSKNLLKELLGIRGNDGACVFTAIARAERYEVLGFLLQLEKWEQYANMRYLLHSLSFAKFNSITPNEMIEKYYLLVKQKSSPLRALQFNEVDWKRNYEDCIKGWKFSSRACLTEKDKEIYYLIKDHFYLLSQPQECNKYFAYLSKEVARYYQETHAGNLFPVLDKTSYEFKVIEELHYPVPNTTFKGIVKDQALQKYLLAFFRQFGIAKEIYKWIGFIPSENANEMVGNGDFFIESRLGVGQFHSPHGHMLQHWLLLMRLLLLDVTNPQVVKNIFQYLAHAQNVWSTVRDQRLAGYQVSYVDPYLLSSVIMFNGHQLGMSVLADSLIDNSCVGLIEYAAVYNVMYKRNFSLLEFIGRYQEFDLSKVEAPEKVLQYEIGRYKNTHKITLFGPTSAAVKLDIVVDPAFKPRMDFK